MRHHDVKVSTTTDSNKEIRKQHHLITTLLFNENNSSNLTFCFQSLISVFILTIVSGQLWNSMRWTTFAGSDGALISIGYEHQFISETYLVLIIYAFLAGTFALIIDSLNDKEFINDSEFMEERWLLIKKLLKGFAIAYCSLMTIVHIKEPTYLISY